MIKSKLNIESFLIIHFTTFITSIVFSFIIFDIVKKNFIELNYIEIIKAFCFLCCLLLLWKLTIKIQTKIIITKNEMIFKKFFKTETIKFEELDFYFEKIEYARNKTYKGIFIVKNDKIIERISSFDYSNYSELKNNINLREYKNFKINYLNLFKVFCGLDVKIKK